MQRSLRRAIAGVVVGMPLAFGGDTTGARDAILDVPGAPFAVVAADLDGDARPDLVALLAVPGAVAQDVDGTAAAAPRLAFLRNAGGGRFLAAVILPDVGATGVAPRGALREVVAADVDLDRDMDLVGVGFPSALWLNAGDGTFVAVALPSEADGDRVAVGDLDGDAAPDLVVARDDEPSVLHVLRNVGAATFAPTAPVAAPGPWPLLHLVVTDVDADTNGESLRDVVAIPDAAAGPPTVLRGLGRGALAAPEASTASPDSLVPFGAKGRFAVADFDGDRRADLAAAVHAPRSGISVLFASDAAGDPSEAATAQGDAPAPLVLVRGRISDQRRRRSDRVFVVGEIPERALASLADPAAAQIEIRSGPATVAATPDVRVTVDVAKRRFVVAAVARDFDPQPSNPVTVTLTTPAGRWRHAAAWRSTRKGELTWPGARARSAAKARDATATAPSGVAPGFDVTTQRIGGADVQILRDRATGRAWRFAAATGQWVPLAPDLAADGGTLAAGLAAFLPLDRDLADAAAGARPAAVSRGGVTIEGGEARFDGTGWLELPHIPLDRRAHAFSMWVRPEGTSDVMGLVEQRDANAGGRHYHLMLRGRLQPYLGFYMNDLAAPDGVARGAWHHLVFQYTGTEQEIWVDGARVAARAAAAYAGAAGVTALGRNPAWSNVGGTHFQGAMRRVRVYGRSLAAGEIASLHRSELPPEAKAPAGTTLTFEGVIDGSDRIVITAKEARWENLYWGTYNTVVKLNGVPWRPRTSPILANDGATRFLPPGVDLSRARLVSRAGRDHASIEMEPGRLILRFVDSLNGVDTYRLVVKFD